VSDGLAYVEGRYCALENARISIFDPGFTHSDAVYDVTSVWKGAFFRLDEHVDRFLNSCRGFSIECRCERSEIKRILATCVQRGGVQDSAYVAMVATRGGYVDDAAERTRDIFRTRPRFLAYALTYKWIAEPAQIEKGLSLIVARTPRIPDSCLNAQYKNYHWGDLTQGKFEARAAGADLAVHLSLDGFLTEGAGYNLFFARDGHLYTPARNILHGITRKTSIELAEAIGIDCTVGDFRASDLREADEAFVTSTAGGIMPVVRIDDRTLGSGRPGPLSMTLRDAYWRCREDGWLSTAVETLIAPGPA
jgi:branched-chain amino acid aminotransferase